MPVSLTVSRVREALFVEAGGASAAGDGRRSTRLLGSLFHETFQQILGGEHPAAWPVVFAEEPARLDAWQQGLQRQVYRHLVGPRIDRHAAALQSAAEEVRLFWEAVEHLCDWIAELVWTTYESTDELPPPQSLVTTEEELRWTLRQPDWSDSVLLSGQADAVWRPPGQDAWCLAELKLGRTYALADLGQACLYHAMLAASEPDCGDAGPLALVSFKPQRDEQLFDPDQLDEARARLVDLIGSLAGVRSDETPAAKPETPPSASSPPAAGNTAGDANGHSGELGRQLLDVLREYDSPAELAGPAIVGPAFVRFPILPARGVRVARITRLADEIKIRLGLEQTPLITSESGQLGVDIQRSDRQFVPFDAVRGQLPAADRRHGCSKVIVGVDSHLQIFFADLAAPENCHLLAAGTTGSGKSQWLLSAIAGLLACNTPETLRLLLIDPKRNAFTDLQQSGFLLRPIVYPDDESVTEVLRELTDEMERRYQAMGGADSFERYLAEQGAPLPRIVCFCDEYFDLVHRGKQARADLEEAVFRLGAKARAAGIHLILATQQPSRDIIRGALDANIPARIALKTNKAIESRMLLGQAGAEHLLGCGDLLFKDIGPPRRLQGVYVNAE